MHEINEVPYTAIRITDGFWSIEEAGVRSFLIEGIGKAMLVDTGYGTGDIKAFAETLTSLPIFLINTHTDRDHIGCNDSFKQVIMHPSEVKYYQLKKTEVHTGIEHVEDGEVIDMGNREFEIIHIPGHTPGSIALLDRRNKILISGDSIQTNAIYMFGEGRDFNTYISSLKKLEEIKDSFETIHPSHGELFVKHDIIRDLIEGAQRVLKGEVEARIPPMSLPCELYEVGKAKFLYREESMSNK